jgi:hypothetical protein
MFSAIRKIFSRPEPPRELSAWDKAKLEMEAAMIRPLLRKEFFGGRLIVTEPDRFGPLILTTSSGDVLGRVAAGEIASFGGFETMFAAVKTPKFTAATKSGVRLNPDHKREEWSLTTITHPDVSGRLAFPVTLYEDDREKIVQVFVDQMNSWKSEDAKTSAPDGVYLDAETDGLYGPTWAICAVRIENGAEVARFEGRQAGYVPENEWVKANCYPHNADIKEVPDLLTAFAAWWLANKGAAWAHMGSPVESGLFRSMHERGLIGDFDGPYPLHDIATALFMAGHPADSVDGYLSSFMGAGKPEGSPHDCRYDVEASIAAMSLLCSEAGK